MACLASSVITSRVFNQHRDVLRRPMARNRLYRIAASEYPEALLFDCDGVLVESERDGHRIAFNETFKRKGEFQKVI